MGMNDSGPYEISAAGTDEKDQRRFPEMIVVFSYDDIILPTEHHVERT